VGVVCGNVFFGVTGDVRLSFLVKWEGLASFPGCLPLHELP